MATRCVSWDSMTITDDDGNVEHPHLDEHVWIAGEASLGEIKAWWKFNRLSTQLDAVRGEEDEAIRTVELLEQHYDELLEFMALRVVDWDLTGPTGRLLPKPDGTSYPLTFLNAQEVYFLRQVLRGEVSEEAGEVAGSNN